MGGEGRARADAEAGEADARRKRAPQAEAEAGGGATRGGSGRRMPRRKREQAAALQSVAGPVTAPCMHACACPRVITGRGRAGVGALAGRPG